MGKMVNSATNCIQKALGGFACTNSQRYEVVSGTQAVKLKRLKRDQPAIVVGGCHGYEPNLALLLGCELADAVVCGNSFAPVDCGDIMRAALSVNNGNGVLLVCSNDVAEKTMFTYADGLLDEANIASKVVYVRDDVLSEPTERAKYRRALAGKLPAVRIASAAAASGMGLEQMFAVTKKASNNITSLGVGFKGDFRGDIFDDVEYGVGMHGEPGVMRAKLQSVDEIVDMAVSMLMEDAAIKPGDRVATYISGIGAISYMSLCMINLELSRAMRENDIAVHDMNISHVVEKNEIQGVSVTVMRMDDELMQLYDSDGGKIRRSRDDG